MKIKVNLADAKSFDVAERYLYQMDKKVVKALHLALDEVGVRMESKLIEELSMMGLGDSSFISRISVRRYGKGLSVSIDKEYVTFVEFGTGLRGMNNPHPNPTALGHSEWQYATNSEHGDGWWYPTTDDDPNPTKYRTSQGDLVAFTRGHESRPFMYNTWLYGKRIMVNTFNKYSKEVIG